jgi:hypothetical protein
VAVGFMEIHNHQGQQTFLALGVRAFSIK